MFSVPTQKTHNFRSLSNFLGVDFSSDPMDVDIRRSPNAVNMISNDGFNETRNGYEILNTIGSKINGVWNVDLDNGTEIFIIHSGTKLYECSSNFQNYTEILTGMTDAMSTGLYFNDYLYIFDGTRAVIYGKVGNSYGARFLDEAGYIPTTSVSRDASGGGTDYEKINLMSPYRINTFLTEMVRTTIQNQDGTESVSENPQTVYKVDDTNITSVELVEVLGTDGNFNVVPSENYTVDLVNGEVTFNTSPGESPVLGRDNVSIRYKKIVQENTDKINKCNIAILFGYNGNNNRIFVSGNPDFPNYDFHSEQEDGTYFPDDNFTKIGTEPIINYSRLADGTLAVQKKKSDTDCTVYYRSTSLLNSEEVFPLADGVKNIGCVSRYANANLLNDPLTLTDEGVFSLTGHNGEKYAIQKSYYINKKLMQEENLENAVAIVLQNKYYLAINNHVYIADYRYQTHPPHGKSSQYQYEWWYWNNLPIRVFFTWNNELYFGTDDGKICKFNDGYTDNGENINSYWETPFIDFNNINYAKTIKRITLVLNPKEQSDITLGYETDQGEVEIITNNYDNLTDDFPKTIQEKVKISKIMFVKFFMKNNTQNRMSFNRLLIDYIYSGKYRGE